MSQAPHQPLDCAARHRCALARQLPPDLVGPIDLHVGLPDALYRRQKGIVAVCSGAALVWLAQQCRLPSVA
jgi:hypothetical protein